MPRDSSGDYTLPLAPVVAGTTIDVAWANPTMDDIKQAMTDSLDRQGRGGMLAPFRFLDGTVGSPGITWTNETNTGIYRAGAGDMRITVSGSDILRWTSSGTQAWDGAIWRDILDAGDIGTSVAPVDSPTFTGTVVLPSTTSIGDVDSTEIAYLDGVTDPIQTQLDTKAETNGDNTETFDVASPTANDQAIRRDTYAASTTGGTVKMRVSGTTLYLRNDGTDA